MRNLKFNPLNYLILAILNFIVLFMHHSWHGYLCLILLSIINWYLLAYTIHWKKLIKFSLILLPALIAMFISSYYFAPADGLNTNNLNQSLQLNQSIILTLRLFTLAFISFGYMLQMPKEQVILNLMQRKIVSVKIGFSLLAVFNAFNYLGQEFQRIQIAYQMRYQQRYLSPKIILPLLVAAARYAHNLSISMYNRGLNQQRSYYYPLVKLTNKDIVLVGVNVALLLVVSFAC